MPVSEIDGVPLPDSGSGVCPEIMLSYTTTLTLLHHMASRDAAKNSKNRYEDAVRKFDASIQRMKIEAQWRAQQSAKAASPDAMARFEEWRTRRQAQKQLLAIAAGTALTRPPSRSSSRTGTRPARLPGMYVGQNAINAITRAVGRERRRRR